MDLIFKQLNTKLKSVDEQNKSIDFVFSTPDSDRHDEIIRQDGWDTKEFMQNPVVLFAHDQWQPAVGQVTQIGMENGNLVGTVKFAAEENPFADMLYKLYKGGFMRAVSVGFRNNKYVYDEETERIELLDNTLFELSLVNVPANARALAKSAGINFDALENKEKELEAMKTKLNAEAIKTIADEVAEQIKSSADIALEVKKVETPTGKGGAKSFGKNRKINKAIRQLLKQKL